MGIMWNLPSKKPSVGVGEEQMLQEASEKEVSKHLRNGVHSVSGGHREMEEESDMG